MAGAARQRGIISGINVTPLVDIMLVLLIIFMLLAHVISKRAIEVQLPHAAASTAPPATPIAITLTKEGQLMLDGKPVTAAALRIAVTAALAADPKLEVIIAGDKNVSHGRVVWVLDLIKSLGVTAFAIQIDPTEVIAPEGS
jgi:biopolymer transport protein ExbD